LILADNVVASRKEKTKRRPLPAGLAVTDNDPIVPSEPVPASTPVSSKRPGTLAAYLELLRPPNVTTAIGDVLAGYAIAGLGQHTVLPWLLASTICLYAGGVVLNDVFDLEIDRVERPERPLPSGRASRGAAAMLGGILLACGVMWAFLATRSAGLVAAATALCILLYDAWGKRQTWVGPVNMGLCRAGNLMLGVAAVPEALAWAWPLAALPLVYTTAVTAVSRGEVQGGKRPVASFALISLLFVLLALSWLSVGGAARGLSPAALALTALLGARLLPPYFKVWQHPAAGTIRTAVRTGVLSLVLLDAVLGAVYAGAVYSAAILATALTAGWLARRFAVT
jgi:4-hydroxybenzoate polyprenyltransferase